MTEESIYLREKARQVAVVYGTHPQVRAAMITGSAAEGESDCYSDIDMSIYYADTLPTDEELIVRREQNGFGEKNWTLGDRDAGTLIESYHRDGIEFQIIHATLAATEQVFETVWSGSEIGTPYNKVMSGILECIPYSGEEIIARWKKRIADYPDSLAEASVKKYLNFTPVWGITEALDSRDGIIWRYQILVETAHNLIGVLAALNHLYFTSFQFKRTARFCRQMAFAPPDAATRINALLTQSPTDAALSTRQLVEETVALVERKMPHIETTAVRKRIGMARKKWEMPR